MNIIVVINDTFKSLYGSFIYKIHEKPELTKTWVIGTFYERNSS